METIATDSGKIVKMEVDYTSNCDDKIPECQKLAKSGKLHDALDQLLALEKQTRTGADMISTGRVLVAICQICREAGNWAALSEHIVLLTKRRSQLKQAVAKMLIDTLRQVTEGDIQEAANIIQELQVETYGSMDKREKVELILEQMRLCTQDLKLKYYRLMMEVDQHEGSYLATCKHYRAVLNTPSVMAVPEERQSAAQAVVLYLILATHDNEQVDLTHRVLTDKILDEIPMYKQLLKLFTTPELIKWSGLCEIYENQLKTTPVFSGNEQAKKRWTDLKSRVVEHNIRVMAKYYTRIRIARIAQLLDLSPAETEEFLSQMVVSKSVQAKTDRPAGVVHFQQIKDPSDTLNDWAHDLSQLMQLVNKTTHLINKEECVHKHLQATA
ncbi:hypothetical protein NQ317_000635 [Molorchus minor]|uniref:PCI domain-containing protein n=1 Tax=Molorchus minor TaxID=1323400 RepID=A0ABQ9JK68_9CUCU|nr:hypothetical protein NQ317_000635 [Molorchus minor]